MLLLKPSCEHCNKALPANSPEAMICSYECTFCKPCVDNILNNVCPNCGGGFCKRPVRPSENLKDDHYLGKDPASTKAVHNTVDVVAHKQFSEHIVSIPANKR